MSDSSFALSLAEAGYTVIPLIENLKARRDGWREMVEKGPDYCRALLMAERGLTGAALVPRPTDPVPLLILDIDDHTGRPVEEIWDSVLPGDPLPETAGISRTANGGIHLWFALPEDIDPNRLPTNRLDLGSAINADLRASRKSLGLLVLPGSRVVRKNGALGAYRVERPIDPQSLPFPPPALMRRILARKVGEDAPKRGQLSTEALHYLAHIKDFIPDGGVTEGNINTFIAQVGQVLGRASLQRQPSDAHKSMIFELLAPKLQSPPFDPSSPEKQRQFHQALSSGWKKGMQNRENHNQHPDNPSVTDVLRECKAIFGEHPWLKEFKDFGSAKTTLVLGLGGTAKTPHDAQATMTLDDMANLLPALGALSGADPDTVVTSPFQTSGSWLKALRYYLVSTKVVEPVGRPPEDLFMEALQSTATRAIEGGRIHLTMGERRKDPGAAFIYWPRAEMTQPQLIIPDEGEQEMALQYSNDIRVAKGLVAKSIHTKQISGRGSKRAWGVPLDFLGDEVVEQAGLLFEKTVSALAKPAQAG